MVTTQTSDPFGAPPPGGSTTTSVQQPIGVPYYIIDPNTGQPAIGPGGQPLRWGAQMNAPAGGPGSLGTQGPGTAPSSGYQYQLPRYFDGDQWLPAQLPPDQLAALQRKMVAAGLLKAGSAQLGVWDAASMQAYMQLLAYANASGLDAQAALDQWGQQHAAAPPGAGLPVQVTNDEDLRKVFRQSIIDTLGQGWDQAKIDQMISAYHGVEIGAQRSAYTAQDQGGTYQTAPSPQAYAAAQAQAENPMGVQEHDLIKQGGPLDAFKQIIGGWA